MSLTVFLSLFKFVQWAPKNAFFLQQRANWPFNQGRSRSSKIDDFGTNRKRVMRLPILVRHHDYGPIVHRFWDTATYWLEIAYFSYPCLIRRPRSLEFRAEVNHEETRVMGLSSSEDRMILAWVVLVWYQRATDVQTDRWTDRIYHS